MKTRHERQQFLIDNPMFRFNDEQKFQAILHAILLSDMFGFNDKRPAAECERGAVVILNCAAPIVWC